jgi:hypothetical protein
LKTGVGYSLYADSETNNFVLTELDQTSKLINEGLSLTSSINFIDHVITKINETAKHAEKIKLLALYQQLYSIDEFDYEYIQKRTGIITNYRQVDLQSFRNKIRNHELLKEFKETEPKKRTKNFWIRTKLAIMFNYTNIELEKHFDKILKQGAIEKYIYFNKGSELCEIILSLSRNVSSKSKDGTHGLIAADDNDTKKEGYFSFQNNDFTEASTTLRDSIEDNKPSTSKQPAQKGFFEWIQDLYDYVNVVNVDVDDEDKDDADEKILIGYYSKEKNGTIKLYGEYYNLWSYIDYQLNNELLSYVSTLDKTGMTIRQFWNTSSLVPVTSEDITTMSKKLKELTKAVAGVTASVPGTGSVRPKGDGFSWKRSPDGRKAKRALREGKITKEEYKSRKAKAKRA